MAGRDRHRIDVHGHLVLQPNLSEAFQRYGMPVMIGDLEKDAAQLKATSPIQQASRILWRRVERFLYKNIGQVQPARPPAAPAG